MARDIKTVEALAGICHNTKAKKALLELSLNRMPDIHPECLDKLLSWLDLQADSLVTEIQGLAPKYEFMRSDLEKVVKHFRFVSLRISASR